MGTIGDFLDAEGKKGDEATLAYGAAIFWFSVDLATAGEGSSVRPALEEGSKVLYRAVGLDELADIFQSKMIRPGGGSLETKLFTETLDDAIEEAKFLKKQFAIISVEITEVIEIITNVPLRKKIGPKGFISMCEKRKSNPRSQL